MSELLAVHRANRALFDPIKSRFSELVVARDNLAAFLFTLQTRALSSHPIRRGSAAHPHAKFASEIASDRFKGLFFESRPVFVVPDGPYHNPPVHSLRVTKATATQYLDFGGSLLTKPDPLRKLGRFAQIRFLSLRRCGLLEVGAELLELPKSVRRLDLSANFLCEIPRTAQWRQLRGLNLADNALAEWPQVLEADLPELEFLSLAGNPIGAGPEHIGCARALRCLDCSNTLLRAPWMGWLAECDRLQVVRLGGATLCVNCPCRYFAMFAQLKLADLSGVEFVGAPLAFGPAFEILVLKGGRPAACDGLDVEVVL
jgi:hypothetical protein